MGVVSGSIEVKTKGNCDVIDITAEVSKVVRDSGLKDGIVTVFVPGSTAGVTTVEYEPGLVEDVSELFERLAPAGKNYHHNLRWHDGNGHSHVRAAILGPSLSVPFRDGKLLLGIWQQIVFVDFDNRSREREILCQIIGE